MGVITTCDIAEGASFGPIPRSLTLVDLTLLIGHMTCDSRPDVHTVKLDVNAYNAGSALGEWLPYVRAARNEHERNIQFSLDDGHMFYHVTHAIVSGRELFVWYSCEFARSLGLPSILPDYVIDASTYKCPKCSQTFRYPNSLRAHMRFKCAFKTVVNNNNNGDVNDRNTSREAVCRKRGLNDASNPEPKRGRYNSVNSTTKSDWVQTELYKNESDAENSSRMLNTLNKNGTDCRISSEVMSAFRKVKNHRSDDFRSLSSDTTEHNRADLKQELAGLEIRRQDARLAHALYARPVNANLLPSLRHEYDTNVMNYVNASKNAMDQQRRTPVKAAFARNVVPEIYSLQERFSSEKMPLTGLSKPLASSQPLASLNSAVLVRDKVNFSLPPFKARNPVVEAMLNTPYRPVVATNFTPVNMLQNWCAKCNATFRMTSDLVYHMRSHHHREFDPSRNKRDSKLQCDTCGETFRERHHLSRHMTSHM